MELDRRNARSYRRRVLRGIFLGLTFMYVLSLAGAGYAIFSYEKYLGNSSPVQEWLNQNATSYSTDIYDTMLAMKEVSLAYRERSKDKTSLQAQQHLKDQAELLEGMLGTFELSTSIGRLIQSYASTQEATRNVNEFIRLLSIWSDNPNSVSEIDIRKAEENAFIAMRRLTIEAEKKEFQARDEMVIAINSSRVLADKALAVGILLFIFGLIALISVYLASKAWVAAERERFERLEYLLSTVGHDLRSPLQAIVSCAQLLKKSLAQSENKAYANIIKDSSEQLARLVDDLVGLARNEELAFEIHPLELALWLDKLHARFAVDAKRKGLAFEVVKQSDLPTIMFDETRLTQCAGNLLANAIRYTETGRIKLEIGHKPVSASDGELLIQVEDTGPGIAESDHKRIFLPFVRASSEAHGKGLGLAIVSSIVRALHGKISLTTTVGIGSAFTISLPVKYPVEVIPDAATPLPSQHAKLNSAVSELSRVLIVDDDRSLRTVFAGIVADMGYLSDQACDGEEGFIFAKCTNYHAIITDIQMSGWDGFEFAQACRNGLDPCPILIAITAYTRALNEDPRSTVFDKILHKPINDELLLAALEGPPLPR